MTPTPHLHALAMRTKAAETCDVLADGLTHYGPEPYRICSAHVLALPLEADHAALFAEAVKLDAVASAMAACRIIDEAVKAGHEKPMDLILHLLTATEPARAALLALETP